MGKGPSLLRFDAFSKSTEDSKIKTTSGGVLTVLCFLTTFLLLINEYKDYCKIVNRPELVVDRDRDLDLDINLDISFPNLPCDLVSLDIMDLTGDVQIDLLNSGFTKTRLSKGEEIAEEKMDANELENSNALVTGDSGYCGSCYGAISQEDNDKKKQEDRICCNSCQSVRIAYANAGWKFYDGKDIEQCENEGYVKRINDRLDEGCRVRGSAKINRIGGNLHFAPGASITQQDKHVHDLSLYDKHKDKFNFDHKINHFSFGLDEDHSNTVVAYETTHPLDGKVLKVNNKYQLFSYFLKVVNTRFEYLNGSSVNTNQFSVTQHDRPLVGGRDDDHPHTIHARGGLPGLFFHFDISPMKIINREEYNKTWSAFMLGACAAIGGVLTVASVLDRTIYTVNKMLKDKKDT